MSLLEQFDFSIHFRGNRKLSKNTVLHLEEVRKHRTFLQPVATQPQTVFFNHMSNTNACFASLSDKPRPRVWGNHRSFHRAEWQLLQQRSWRPGGWESSLQHGPASSAPTGNAYPLHCCESGLPPLQMNKHLMALFLISTNISTIKYLTL